LKTEKFGSGKCPEIISSLSFSWKLTHFRNLIDLIGIFEHIESRGIYTKI